MSEHVHDTPPDLVRVGIAASLCARSPRTLTRWTASGILREFRDEHGTRYYSLAELRALAPRPVALRETPCESSSSAGSPGSDSAS